MGNKEKQLTLEDVKKKVESSYFGIYETIQWIDGHSKKYPKEPSKPRMPKADDIVALKAYITDFEDYQTDKAAYDLVYKEVQQWNGELESLTAEYIKEESGLSKIPKVAQDKVWLMAWDRGHSSGLHEVYQYLIDLVELFEGL